MILLNCLQFSNLFVFSRAGENLFKSTLELLGFPFGKLCQTFSFQVLCALAVVEDRERKTKPCVVYCINSNPLNGICLILLFFINYSEAKLS